MILSLSLSLSHCAIKLSTTTTTSKLFPARRPTQTRMKSKYPKNNKSQSKQQLNNNNKCKASINNKGLKKPQWVTQKGASLGYHALDEEVLITLYSSNGTHQQEHHHHHQLLLFSNPMLFLNPSSTTFQFQLLQIEFNLQLDLVVKPYGVKQANI